MYCMTSMMIKGKSSEFVLNENKVFGEWSCYISNLLESSKKKQNTKKWSICSSSEDLCSNVKQHETCGGSEHGTPRGLCCKNQISQVHRCVCNEQYSGQYCDMLKVTETEANGDCNAKIIRSNDLAVLVAAATVVIILAGMAGYIKYWRKDNTEISERASRRNTECPRSNIYPDSNPNPNSTPTSQNFLNCQNLHVPL